MFLYFGWFIVSSRELWMFLYLCLQFNLLSGHVNKSSLCLFHLLNGANMRLKELRLSGSPHLLFTQVRLRMKKDVCVFVAVCVREWVFMSDLKSLIWFWSSPLYLFYIYFIFSSFLSSVSASWSASGFNLKEIFIFEQYVKNTALCHFLQHQNLL